MNGVMPGFVAGDVVVPPPPEHVGVVYGVVGVVYGVVGVVYGVVGVVGDVLGVVGVVGVAGELEPPTVTASFIPAAQCPVMLHTK